MMTDRYLTCPLAGIRLQSSSVIEVFAVLILNVRAEGELACNCLHCVYALLCINLAEFFQKDKHVELSATFKSIGWEASWSQ